MKVKGLEPILAPVGTKKPRIIKKDEIVDLDCDGWCKQKIKEGFLLEYSPAKEAADKKAAKAKEAAEKEEAEKLAADIAKKEKDKK